jgi:hypothetical protein
MAMSERLVLVGLLGLLVGCQPRVPVGSDDELGFETLCGLTEAVSTCPMEAWGPAASFDSVATLKARLIRRWTFCGGEQRYTGRAPWLGFYGGSGVEFWDDGGVLRFAYLQGPSASKRRSEDFAVGTVRLSVEGGTPRAVLVSKDGVEAAWQLEVFDQQPVLRNSAFDVWNFVAAP